MCESLAKLFKNNKFTVAKPPSLNANTLLLANTLKLDNLSLGSCDYTCEQYAIIDLGWIFEYLLHSDVSSNPQDLYKPFLSSSNADPPSTTSQEDTSRRPLQEPLKAVPVDAGTSSKTVSTVVLNSEVQFKEPTTPKGRFRKKKLVEYSTKGLTPPALSGKNFIS